MNLLGAGAGAGAEAEAEAEAEAGDSSTVLEMVDSLDTLCLWKAFREDLL